MKHKVLKKIRRSLVYDLKDLTHLDHEAASARDLVVADEPFARGGMKGSQILRRLLPRRHHRRHRGGRHVRCHLGVVGATRGSRRLCRFSEGLIRAGELGLASTIYGEEALGAGVHVGGSEGRDLVSQRRAYGRVGPARLLNGGYWSSLWGPRRVNLKLGPDSGLRFLLKGRGHELKVVAGAQLVPLPLTTVIR